MSKYQHVLIAVDLTEESHQVIEKGQGIAERNGAKISLIHALEPLGFAYGGDIPMDLTSIQDQLDQHARAKIADLAAPLNIPQERQHILVGLPDSEIHRIAKEQGVDLIVVGSHGRHGLSLLLGSTSTGVLHGAKCDVLAVRIQKED
ncbi:universal stress protein A [Oceanospirillum multiglobuliferum]|uniref:Universal stress protein n=1 Tax=Oceanospirillum multiglobuliferum TaxID=64969 RepID=A0A1T4MNV4_9GAMM|nr:universal stress protein [Oceanospirillum multiglobuliferum]OPX56953.1 universal stress protein UspA [Oceanospirillum multiglobuliferum]SJZ68495.1 universal stress protein A [Oceanospirillum multiglobuliferum]